jgi:hypothetical protein
MPSALAAFLLSTKNTNTPDFALLLCESAKRRREHARAKRNNQIAAIDHCPSPGFQFIGFGVLCFDIRQAARQSMAA